MAGRPDAAHPEGGVGTMNERVAAEVDRELTPEEARAYLDHPVTSDQREEVLALVRWFTRRYPTPAARLAYVRRAYARWTRGRR
jgi:hypothetical protein